MMKLQMLKLMPSSVLCTYVLVFVSLILSSGCGYCLQLLRATRDQLVMVRWLQKHSLVPLWAAWLSLFSAVLGGLLCILSSH